MIEKAPLRYDLMLFVADHEAETRATERALREALDQSMPGGYRLRIINVLQNPGEAEAEKVFATPMLIRASPTPPIRMLGDLSNPTKVLSMLGIGGAEGG